MTASIAQRSTKKVLGPTIVCLTLLSGALSMSFSPPPGWSDWASLGSPSGVALDGLAVAVNQDFRLEVIANGRSDSGTLWYNSQTAPNAASWTNWLSLGVPPGRLLTSTIAAGRNLDGQLEAFILDLSGTLWHIFER